MNWPLGQKSNKNATFKKHVYGMLFISTHLSATMLRLESPLVSSRELKPKNNTIISHGGKQSPKRPLDGIFVLHRRRLAHNCEESRRAKRKREEREEERRKEGRTTQAEAKGTRAPRTPAPRPATPHARRTRKAQEGKAKPGEAKHGRNGDPQARHGKKVFPWRVYGMFLRMFLGCFRNVLGMCFGC